MAIAEGRHVDVLEMDAASRTGVGDIREIIDGVAYRAASARYKVYIIDEVHMLSTSAFNALLKTLEEPPAHVKFIFATTEIRKVPVTVLSRCQRFDLRRIEPEAMLAISEIAEAEGVRWRPTRMALITRAAEGSMRDALSLLDQAIAHGAGESDGGRGPGDARARRPRPGARPLRGGDARRREGALAELAAQYAAGADPLAVLRDLAEVTHWVSMVRLTPRRRTIPTVGPDERARGLDFAGRLSMRALTRMWQMLLKALEEVAAAPNAIMAAEMAIIRLTHVADLPTPEELVRRLGRAACAAAGAGGRAVAARGAAGRGGRGRGGAGAGRGARAAGAGARAAGALRAVRGRGGADPGAAGHEPAGRGRDGGAPGALCARADRVRAGRGGAAGSRGAAGAAAAALDRGALGGGGRGRGGAATIAEVRATEKGDLEARALKHPMVQAVLAAFPGAGLKDVRPPDGWPRRRRRTRRTRTTTIGIRSIPFRG